MDQTEGLASYWRIPADVAQRLRDELIRHTMANDELFEQILAQLEESRQRVLELPERVQAMHASILALPESERESALLAGRIELTRTINDPWLNALDLMGGLDTAETNRDGRIRELMESVWGIVPRPDELIWQPFPATPPTMRNKVPLPTEIRQRTFQEMRNMAIGMADGPSLRRWAMIDGESALSHVIPGQPIQTKFTASPTMLGWWGVPAGTYDLLREELKEAGLPAVVLAHVAVGLALHQQRVTVALDDLIRLSGLEPRSTVERQQERRRIWRWLLMLESMWVIGARPGRWRDPRTRQLINLTSQDPLLRIMGSRPADQQALDGSDPPIEVTFAAGEWLEQHRGNRQVLADYGDILKIARIPAGKPAGAWAQSIGLALNQRWRERAHDAQVTHPGEENRLTVRFAAFNRADLLDLFRADPYFRDVLNGDHPKRAQLYWNQAIQILKQDELIGHYYEREPRPAKRQGWQDAWLTQPLDIRPTDEGRYAAAEIATKTATAKRGRKRQKPPIES